MTLEILRPHMKDIMAPFITASRKIGLTPNNLTVGAFLTAAAAGIFFFLGNVLFGTLLVAFNALLDGLDGALARAENIQSPRGDFLDHVVDRYADIFIITGIFAGGYASWQVGVLALTGVLMSSYLGTQAQAVGVGRYYGGVLGRADRLVLILCAGLLTMVVPAFFLGLSILGWLLVVFGVMGHITAAQRFLYIWRRMP
ncbi:MAG: CDP-alcohol phosphatidyltransferase family protein [Methanolinea sp.]|jgi:archaetidylinositol phosphate synthase|nr:CDP-alcohol phosphatidyltransferase family protein [Methanolinea sp.]